LSGYISKANKGDIFMKGDFIPCASRRQCKKAALQNKKETNKFKAMINIKENAVICLGYPDYASFKNSTGLKWSLVLIIIT
jgi:hypothetical protein